MRVDEERRRNPEKFGGRGLTPKGLRFYANEGESCDTIYKRIVVLNPSLHCGNDVIFIPNV